jgi:ABC-type multidrug transport system permease subunit
LYWVVWREWLLTKAQWTTLAVRLTSTLLIAIVIATGFTNLGFYEASPKLGFFMFVLANIATITFQEMPRIVATKSVCAQQVRYGQYPAATPAVSALVLSLPVTLVETVVYCAIVYFPTGLDSGGTAFITFIGILLVLHLSMATFFRLAAYAASSAEVAQVTLGLVLTILELASGYLLPPNKLGWWIWMYYALPYGKYQ